MRNTIAVGLSAALVVLTAVGCATSRGTSLAGKVLIVSDGSVKVKWDAEFKKIQSGQSKKYRWSEKASNVWVYDCKKVPDPASEFAFTLVQIEVTGGDPPVEIHFTHGTDGLIAAFEGPYDIKGRWWWRGFKHLEKDYQLMIGRVTVTNGDKPQKFSFAGKTCVKFVN